MYAVRRFGGRRTCRTRTWTQPTLIQPSPIASDDDAAGTSTAVPAPPTSAPPPPEAPPRARPDLRSLVVLLGGSALFVSGYTLGRQAGSDPGTPASQRAAFQPFWDTYHSITDRYAGGSVDRRPSIQGAIRGMIGALGDPYSAYLSSDEYRQSLQGISGQFEGIGAEITARRSTARRAARRSGRPAGWS